jgi:two-component system nitrate/nitrite response regulator NarL
LPSPPPKPGRRDRVTIRVVAADPQPLFRDALARAIAQQPRLELVAEVAEGPAALVTATRLDADVLVIDEALLRSDGRSLVEALPEPEQPARVLLLAVEVDPADAFAAIQAGAAGYLSKDLDGAALGQAMVRVAQGETVLDAQVQTGLAREIRLRAQEDRPVLSAREQEVLRLIASGLTAPDIAKRLHLSTATVKTHILHLYEKLGVAERAAAVAEAMRQGLLE